MNKKTLLLILDGWGKSTNPNISAIDQAGPLYFHQLLEKYPNALLTTHGLDVGLPEGQMGNSEVGHMNIGAGRVVYQELQRINQAIKTGELVTHQSWINALEYAKENRKTLHLIGLYSDGGVHSHFLHFHALIKSAHDYGLEKIAIHAFTDGRDTEPKSAKKLLKDLEIFLKDYPNAFLASVVGRYYAMDRDKRWERVRIAYDLLTTGKGEPSQSISKTIENRYLDGETDEFLKPIILPRFESIKEGDAVFCVNFRTDRCREITQVLTQPDFRFEGMKPISVHYTTMTEYSKDFKNVNVVFSNDIIVNSLGEVLAANKKTQMRMAETEKYPHVTFFFSGGREVPFEGEERIMVPSPKVSTYDLKPEMSALEIKDNLLKVLEEGIMDSIIVNFANTDMVGHTGVFDAAVAAVRTVDSCLLEIVPKAIKNNYQILITADHGNSDYMINPDGTPNTAHSTNPVPIIAISENVKSIRNGRLADVAPTILKLMEINQPKEMTGEILIS